MPPNPDRTDPEESIETLLGFGRRPVLKALGAVGALALGSGAATADDESDGAEIDPTYGKPVPDAEEIPEALEPDHEVELHREFPEDLEDPDRPSIFHFEPSGLNVDEGDVVAFRFTDPNHTVTAYHPEHGFQRRVPECVPPFSSPIVQKDGAWLYRFEEAGLYDLYCGPHEIAGMAMRVVVGDLAEADVPEYEDTFEAEPPLFPPLAPEMLELELNAPVDGNEGCEWPWLTDRMILDADAVDPTEIQEKGEVQFADVADELGIEYDPDEHQ